jgi:phage gpG-like protein
VATIRVSVVGTKELKRKLAKLNPGQNKRIMVKSLTDCAVEIQADATLNQIRGGRGFKFKAYDKRDVLATKLTSRTGDLIGSIGLNKRPLPGAIEVGTHLVYGAMHEQGLGRMKKRPFLEPALDKVGSKFNDIIVKNWKKEARL